MINLLKRTIFHFVFLLSFLNPVLGQDGYRDGYIVTRLNDTLYGKIKDRKASGSEEIYTKIRFKGEGKKKRFSPNEVQSYKTKRTKFKSFLINGKMTFLKVVSEGYVSHYIHELKEQGELLVMEIDYFKKRNSSNLIRATQGLFGLKRKRIINFFNDCPPLVQKLRNKEFRHPSEVVQFYNEWRDNH